MVHTGKRAPTFVTPLPNPSTGSGQAPPPYDPARATQNLADAGWRRAPDGRLVNAAGEQAQVEIRTTSAQASVIQVVAADWRQLGIDATQYIWPAQLRRDPEAKSKFPGIELRARGQNESVFSTFDSREAARPENRYRGANNTHYSNPALDSLIDRLYVTLDPLQRATIMKEMGEILAEDLPALPFYFTADFLVLRNTVGGTIDKDYLTITETGANARNVHLWERT